MEIHPEAASRFDQLGIDLLSRLKPCATTRPTSTVKPDIYPIANFSAEDVIGPIKMKTAIVNGEGEEVGRVIKQLNLSVSDADYKALKDLAAAMLRSNPIGKVASLEYLTDRIWEWLEKSALEGVRAGLAAHISDALNHDVSDQELWFPLHRVHCEIELQMGKARFKTLDGRMMQRWHEAALACVPEDTREKVTEYYNRLRSKMQGSLAAVVQVTGEPRKAHEDGVRIAQMAVSMLRFVSPVNFSPRIRSFCTLLGDEAIATTNVLTVKDGDLIGRSQSAERGEHVWLIRPSDLALLPAKLLSLLSDLSSDHNTNYAKQLYDALLIYSRNSIAKETSDKLVFVLVALESMLLRDDNEPIQKNVGERMALIAGTTVEERKAVVTNLGEVYKLRSKFVHHGQSTEDIESLYPFMVNAWTCFCNLLGWQKRFATKDDLISWLESRKLSG
jgi:hypothetical protein